MLCVRSSAMETPTPPPEGRVHKRQISDQQKRRDEALLRQKHGREDRKNHARDLASSFFSIPPQEAEAEAEVEAEAEESNENDEEEEEEDIIHGVFQATKLRGFRAREWFKQQFMMPEWMVDIPHDLAKNWYVLPRPSGHRCLVVSSHGITISRLRNGRILHRFSSLLPSGNKSHGSAIPSRSFCILDCIFHEPDSTYYIIDMMSWQGCSLYDCEYEFRSFWIKSKIDETQPSQSPQHQQYRFATVHAMECNLPGLEAAYTGTVPFERDGCLFMNKNAHYTLGVTPLALLWKDSACSKYTIDTDSKGNVPAYQQVVLKLQEGGTVVTSDDPPVVLGIMPQQFLQQNKKHLKTGMMLRFAVGDQGLRVVDGRPIVADIHYQGTANRSRAAADSVSKILFQYAARHAPLSISHLYAAVQASESVDADVQMS